MDKNKLKPQLLEKLQSFILENGKGFSLVGNKFRILAETGHYHIDIVFYNYPMKCFFLINLKTTRPAKQDIRQMELYIRLFEASYKETDDNPSIGIIVYPEKKLSLIKYCLLSESKQLYISKYQFYFPAEQQLDLEIQKVLEQLEKEGLPLKNDNTDLPSEIFDKLKKKRYLFI